MNATPDASLDADLQAIQLKVFKGQPLTAAEQSRWYQHLSQSGSLAGRATEVTDFAPPGARVGATGGLLPDQGAPLPPGAPVANAFELGRRDRAQADNYYAGMTGQPPPAAPGTPARAPVTAAAAAPAPKPAGPVRVGERDPYARAPGAGQGTIRRGADVFAYIGGSAVKNEDGSRAVFGNEGAAMDYLDMTESRRPVVYSPRNPAPSIANPGVLQLKAPPAPAGPVATVPPTPPARPVKPAPAAAAPPVQPTGPSTFDQYGVAGLAAQGAKSLASGVGAVGSAALSAASYYPAAVEGAAEGMIGKRGVAAVKNVFNTVRPKPAARSLMPATPGPADNPLTARPPPNPMTARPLAPDNPLSAGARGGQPDNPLSAGARTRGPSRSQPYQAAADRFNPFSTRRTRFGIDPFPE